MDMPSIIEQEIWKEVHGWPYEVSSRGRVRRITSAPGTQSGHILRPDPNQRYLKVSLKDKGRTWCVHIHKLVSLAFLGLPLPKQQINHKDGARHNNNIDNLEYVTMQQNMDHAVLTGKIPRGVNNHKSIVTPEQVMEMRKLRSEGMSPAQIGKLYGLSISGASHAVDGRSWAYLAKIPPIEKTEETPVIKEPSPVLIPGEPQVTSHIAASFWAKTKQGGEDECWLWQGHVGIGGYGKLNVKPARSPLTAHRISYEIQHGPIPVGMLICHRCDNRKCVNPAHLFLGTHADNTSDMVRKGRARGGPKTPLRGSKVTGAKLDDKKVVEIIRLRRAGASKADLSRKFDVSPGVIYSIEKGLTWKHVVTIMQPDQITIPNGEE